MPQPSAVIGRDRWRRWPPAVRVLVGIAAVSLMLAVVWASLPTTTRYDGGGDEIACAPAIFGSSANPSDSGGQADRECDEAQWRRIRPVLIAVSAFVVAAGIVCIVLLRRGSAQRPLT